MSVAERKKRLLKQLKALEGVSSIEDKMTKKELDQFNKDVKLFHKFTEHKLTIVNFIPNVTLKVNYNFDTLEDNFVGIDFHDLKLVALKGASKELKLVLGYVEYLDWDFTDGMYEYIWSAIKKTDNYKEMMKVNQRFNALCKKYDGFDEYMDEVLNG
jgi:hypothetical protein